MYRVYENASRLLEVIFSFVANYLHHAYRGQTLTINQIIDIEDFLINQYMMNVSFWKYIYLLNLGLTAVISCRLTNNNVCVNLLLFVYVLRV